MSRMLRMILVLIAVVCISVQVSRGWTSSLREIPCFPLASPIPQESFPEIPPECRPPAGELARAIALGHVKNKSIRDEIGKRQMPAPQAQQNQAATFIHAKDRATSCRTQYMMSQYNEDAQIAAYFSKLLGREHPHEYRGRPLFFVEMGALDGLAYSNTFYLENCFGWRGLLIEAMPKNFEYVMKNRPCTDKAWLAAGPRGVAKFEYHGSIAASSFSNPNAADEKTVYVPMSPMHEVFASRHIERVDFWSLDVEGSELAVLETVDWSRVSVGLLMFETLKSAPKAKVKALKDLLMAANMSLVATPKVANSQIWVTKKHIAELSSQL